MGTIISILSIFMMMLSNNIQTQQFKSSTNDRIYEVFRNSEVSSVLFNIKTTEKPVNITISAVGDCTIGYDVDFGYSGSYDDIIDKNGFEYPLKNVLDYFQNDDITVANLETTLTNSDVRAVKEFKFKGKPEYTNILSKGSVEVVNISNNHIYDYLEKGFKDTISNLESSNIGFFGQGEKFIKEVKGVKIGFLGYTGWSDEKNVKDKIYDDIQELKKQCRIIVVSFHWGIERDNYPNTTQTNLGRFCIDSGADLVLGHHPHVIQGIETYKGKHIVYSMGNFTYGGHKNPADKDTFIFRENFIISGENTDLGESEVVPCLISSTKSYNNYQPTPLLGDEAIQVMDRLRLYSSSLQYGYKFEKEMISKRYNSKLSINDKRKNILAAYFTTDDASFKN